MNPKTSATPKDATNVGSPSLVTHSPLVEASLPVVTDFHAVPSRIAAHSLKSHYFGAFQLYATSDASNDAGAIVRQYLNRWIRGYLSRVWDESLAIGHPKQSSCARQGEVDYSSLSVPTDKGLAPIESFALEHTDRDETGRRWRTEVVIIPTKKGIRLHVGVYHGLRVDYVGAEPRLPSPSLPGFVRGLYSEPGLQCLANGVQTSHRPLSVSDSWDSGEFFAKYLANKDRALPVILVNPLELSDLRRFALDPERLARTAVGAGTVIIPKIALRRTGPFLQAVGARLGHGYTSGLADGGIRVYLPLLDPTNPRDVLRHRYFKAQGDPLVEKAIRESLFRCAQSEVLRRGDVSTFAEAFELCEEVRDRAKWRATIESIELITKNSKENPQPATSSSSSNDPEALLLDNDVLRAENKRLQDLIADLQPKIMELQAQAAGLADEKKVAKKLREEIAAAEELLDSSLTRVQGLEDELDGERQARHDAEAKVEALRIALGAKEFGDESRRELKIPVALPESPQDVVRYLQKALKPRVVILDNAVGTAKELSTKLTTETWHYLVALHQELWPLHFSESEVAHVMDDDAARVRIQKIPSRFTEKTSIDYVVNESSMTQKQEKLMRQRRGIVDGMEYDFTPHLRGGSHPDFLRVHFAVDNQNKRILVWHVGGHLDTAGTRRLGY